MPGLGKGPKPLPGCDGGKSKQKYQCHGCSLAPRGTDLPKHYLKKTDWELVKKLRDSMGTAAMEQLVKLFNSS